MVNRGIAEAEHSTKALVKVGLVRYCDTSVTIGKYMSVLARLCSNLLKRCAPKRQGSDILCM